jgi:hypothetical protein
MKDSFLAKLSFFLSLGFWVPLFNVGLCTVSIFLAVSSIRKIIDEPKTYGGMGYAVAALVLSVTSIVLTVVGLVWYLFFSDAVCSSAMCQQLMR